MKAQSVNLLVKVLVVFHLIAITIWALPDPSKDIQNETIFREKDGRLVKAVPKGTDWLLYYNWRYVKTLPLRYYLMSTGLWQYWDMFAPNPSDWDGYIDAMVTYKNGEQKVYQYPRMKLLNVWQKYIKERYRKFLERAHLEKESWMWPRFAQRIAMEAMTDKNNPPIEVVLRRHWKTIQPPGKPQPKEYEMFEYYTHQVNLQQLLDESASIWAR